jgi:hypothetical protein
MDRAPRLRARALLYHEGQADISFPGHVLG